MLKTNEHVDTDRHLARLALENGTPLYVYDLRRLRRRIAEFNAALGHPETDLYFATMANDLPQILKLLATEGVGACVNSIPHLNLAMEAGFGNDKIQFTSTGVNYNDMCILQGLDIRLNIDSLQQLDSWLKIGTQEVAIRINAASLMGQSNGDRIGIEPHAAADVERKARKYNLHLNGLHIYVGTNFQQPGEMLPILKSFFEFAEGFKYLKYINVGGGIGVNYQHNGPDFDFVGYGNGIKKYSKNLRGKLKQPNLRVIVEPGRGLVADCATFITSVTDIKQLDGRRFASVDSSIAIFPRPFHHPNSPHRIRQLTNTCVNSLNKDQHLETIIVGRTTFSKDILGSALLSKNLQIGDLLAFDDAGAYSQSMMSRFLGQTQPNTVFLDE